MKKLDYETYLPNINMTKIKISDAPYSSNDPRTLQDKIPGQNANLIINYSI